ncbi:TldD/PmbA family protein [Fervidicoccus fontis]|uniref:TldD/PmbA family protein n=1 Tax=Fervidicoccus fontis TaxID=683846 RepID=A0A843AAC6_9CREN|nr:TldD/PmbA family protein [Fervidicoccus fontis]MBE9391655.1 TldD/PmbA family protein [Fervidicoccus fontis]
MDEDLLRKALDYALTQGAKYAEIRFHKNEENYVILRNGNLISAGKSSRKGIAIRVLYNGNLAFSSTNDISKESIFTGIDKAIANAKALNINKKENFSLSEERSLGKSKYEVYVKESFDQLPIDEKISYLKNLYMVALDSVKNVKLNAMFESYSDEIEEKVIVNSDGGYVESKIPRLYFFGNIIIYDPQKGSMQKMIEKGASGGLELLKGWRLEDEIKNDLKSLEKVLLEGKSPPKDAVDVVVGSEIVGLIVHESAGHPMEADRIWGRESAQAGESFVKPEMIGKVYIGNSNATVIDDPTIPESNGFYLYDDETVPARKRYIYYKGLLNEPLHNRWTASVFKTNSNGGARAMDYTSEPIVRMSNTYLEPGDMTFEELIEDINFGIFIKSYMEWNIDDIRWGQRYVGLESYLIERGEISEPVLNPVLQFNTREFYSSIISKDKNLEFSSGTCGKGEPHQGVPVWHGGPNIRLSKMKVGVIA